MKFIHAMILLFLILIFSQFANAAEVTSKMSGSFKDVERLSRIVDVVRVVINSDAFKQRVEGAYYKGKKKFVDTALTNEQVYQTLMAKPWALEIGVERARCSTLGWTYPSIKKFYINSCGFNSRKDSGLAGTICHEYSHKLGFKHTSWRSSARPYSVPYSVGTICAELYEVYK
jgi:hypothetical protein